MYNTGRYLPPRRLVRSIILGSIRSLVCPRSLFPLLLFLVFLLILRSILFFLLSCFSPPPSRLCFSSSFFRFVLSLAVPSLFSSLFLSLVLFFVSLPLSCPLFRLFLSLVLSLVLLWFFYLSPPVPPVSWLPSSPCLSSSFLSFSLYLSLNMPPFSLPRLPSGPARADGRRSRLDRTASCPTELPRCQQDIGSCRQDRSSSHTPWVRETTHSTDETTTDSEEDGALIGVALNGVAHRCDELAMSDV